MYVPDQPEGGQRHAPGPRSAVEAAATARAALGRIADLEVTILTSAEQAECLRELERVSAAHLAARSRVLAAFDASAACADDGHGTTRSWLRWQTRVTGAAAGDAVAWMRRLNNHRTVLDALAAGQISVSWARAICDWTERLPDDAHEAADIILLAAAASGADLSDLAGLAEEMRRRTARPDAGDDDDGFQDRSVRLDIHFRGTGRLDGDLTPRCAAALAAVLDALGKKAGPEDTRTAGQRRHDALEEACRRLIGSACLPDRAGQPTQIQLSMTLRQLARPGRLAGPATHSGGTNDLAACQARCRGSGTNQTGPVDGKTEPTSGSPPRPSHGQAEEFGSGEANLFPTAAPGDECDASIAPVVVGHVDRALLDKLAAMLLRGRPERASPSTGNREAAGKPSADNSTGRDQNERVGHHGSAMGWRAARELVLSQAIALLAGPAGAAAYLRRTTLTGPAASISLPLDVGAVTDTIPPHLRRAVISRDRHCTFPGCQQPPAACQVHHLVPRSAGGATKLANLALMCTFHHLIVVHRWNWVFTLNADGTTTAASPDGAKIYHSHSPPTAAA